jgi:uncharacterized membrane protein
MVRRRDALLLAAYAALLISLAQLRPFWLDEALQLIGSTRPDIRGVVQWVVRNPGAVPLGYLTQHLFIATFGLTRLSARAGPAIFSMFSLIAVAGFAREMKSSATSILLIAFLVLPMQLRYAVEGRGYSEALFFAIAALWCLWRYAAAPSSWIAVLYAVLVAAGLYTQPLSASVQFGALFVLALDRQYKIVRTGCIALGIACLAFVPWYIYAASAWRHEIIAGEYSFTLTPRLLLVLLREVSGDGYVASLSLLAAAALGWRHTDSRLRRFLLGSAISCVVCTIAADAAFGYFFASRQVLFVLPALVLLATYGLGSLRQRPWQSALVVILVVASLAKNVSYFRSPGEDWPGAARALRSATSSGTCAIVPSPEYEELYRVFDPGLSGSFCTESDAAGPVVVVASHYSLRTSLARITRVLAERGFRANGETQAAGLRLTFFLPGS